MTLWRYDIESQQVSLFDVGAPEQLNGADFLSIAFTDLIEKKPENRFEDSTFVNYAIIGTSKGQLVSFDLNEHKYDNIEASPRVAKG